jgi:hypothetical protein
MRRAASVRPEPGSNSPSRSGAVTGRLEAGRTGLRSESRLSGSLTRLRRQCPSPPGVAGHGIDVGSDPSTRLDIGSSLAFELHCSVFKKRLPDGRAPRGALVSEGHTLHEVLGLQAARTQRERSVGVNRSRRSGASKRSRPACGAKSQVTDRPNPCQTLRFSARAPAPTAVSRSGRRAVRRAAGRPRSRPSRRP